MGVALLWGEQGAYLVVHVHHDVVILSVCHDGCYSCVIASKKCAATGGIGSMALAGSVKLIIGDKLSQCQLGAGMGRVA